jgi:hypothetical protein
MRIHIYAPSMQGQDLYFASWRSHFALNASDLAVCNNHLNTITHQQAFPKQGWNFHTPEGAVRTCSLEVSQTQQRKTITKYRLLCMRWHWYKERAPLQINQAGQNCKHDKLFQCGLGWSERHWFIQVTREVQAWWVERNACTKNSMSDRTQ